MKDTITIKNLGELKQDEQVKDWFRSDEIEVDFFGGKALPFVLKIEKEIDAALQEKIDSAVINFLSLNSEYRDSISGLVYENYNDTLEIADIEPLEIEDESEIWNYVHPYVIYIDQRNRRDEDIYIQVTCHCDWDEEHGLQLVFRQGKKITRVSPEDGHLTKADAYNKEDSEDKLLSSF